MTMVETHKYWNTTGKINNKKTKQKHTPDPRSSGPADASVTVESEALRYVTDASVTNNCATSA